MRYVKDSPFEVSHRVWQLRPPQPSLTVIVKGSFEPGPGGTMTPAPAQVPMSGEVFWDDDPERSVRAPDDYALIKPKGECFVIGRAWAPGAQPTPATECRFRIGPVEKSFTVFGDRTFRSPFRSTLSPTGTFTSMPLTMDFAYGGRGYGANPWGRGRDADEDGMVPLPNLELPGSYVTSPESKPDPVIVGPLPTTWPARQRFAGTYDGHYMRTRWPWLPVDFDWRFFMAAPLDQQLRQGYWRGDEQIELKNLHRSLPTIRGQLPGVLPRLFIEGPPRAGQTHRRFEEISLVLDTVTWDAELGKLLLCWRGSVEVESEDLTDVEHLYLAHDPLGGPVRSAAELHAAYRAKVEAEEAEERAAEGEPPPLPAEDTEEHSIDFDSDQTSDEAEFERLFGETQRKADEYAASGEAAATPETAPPDPLEALAGMKAAGIEIPEGVEESIREGLAEEEDDTDEPDPEDEPLEESPDETRGREILLSKLQNGESLQGLDLTGADLSDFDLSGHDLTGSIFARADLSRARFVSSTLVDCNFQEATLFRADLSGATLDGADMTGARLKWSDLHEASLADAVFDGASLNEARLTECSAVRAMFVGAELIEAVLCGGDFLEADFERAKLDRADLRGARLERASLERASAKGACFEHALMTKVRGEGLDARGALLGSIDAEGSIWRGATLSRVSFAFAKLARADFSGAVLIGTTLDGCAARKSRFIGANAHSLSARKADLMEATFESADLTYAQLGGANLYGAEFWRAKLEHVWLELADVTRTKLEPQ